LLFFPPLSTLHPFFPTFMRPFSPNSSSTERPPPDFSPVLQFGPVYQHCFSAVLTVPIRQTALVPKSLPFFKDLTPLPRVTRIPLLVFFIDAYEGVLGSALSGTNSPLGFEGWSPSSGGLAIAFRFILVVALLGLPLCSVVHYSMTPLPCSCPPCDRAEPRYSSLLSAPFLFSVMQNQNWCAFLLSIPFAILPSRSPRPFFLLNPGWRSSHLPRSFFPDLCTGFSLVMFVKFSSFFGL